MLWEVWVPADIFAKIGDSAAVCNTVRRVVLSILISIGRIDIPICNLP